MLFILLFFLQILPSSSISNFPIVATSFGSIRGYEYKNEAAFTAQIFKKLPFAAPPIGDLRWRKPQLPSNWNNTIDGTFFGPACAQRTLMYTGPITGFSEDCLHVNVYTNEKCRKSSSCSVIFIIHGGLGIYESTMKFPDETLVTNFVSQDIVVVTTAYRVGAFGIMALGDENALPANLAMHDVLAALKFTRNEIHAFGGDKERITIMGHSTGAQIALNFAFSPGISPPGVPRLFSSVISMSGPLGLEKEEKQVERSHLVANQLKCSGTAREIVACMKKKTTILGPAFSSRLFPPYHSYFQPSPHSTQILDAAFEVQEGDIFNERGLIGLMMGGELMPIRSAKELRENNQPIRMMIGTTFYETKDFGNNSTEIDEDKVNRVLGIDNDEECFEKYLEDRKSGEFVTEHTTDSQALFMTAYSLAKEQSESGGEVYLYSYDYPKHALHTDDAYFVLGFHVFQKDLNEEWLSRVYPRYFANFVNGGRPAPDWYQLKPNLMNYYSVNKNETSDEVPHMKFGYQKDIADYYTGMMEYDRRLTTRNHVVLNAPIEYH